LASWRISARFLTTPTFVA